MSLQAQRGNVTIITALSAMLLLMIIVLSSGLGQDGGGATRIQAGSDEAAVTAAISLIEVQNDEVMFDLIDSALTFLQHLADIVARLGNLLMCCVFTAPIGTLLSGVGGAVSSIAGTLDKAINNIKKALDPLLEQAKSILAIINATVIAANNNYLGFVLPNGTIQAAGQAKYTKDDVDKITKHARQIIDNAAFVKIIENGALHTIWGSDFDVPQKSQNRLGPGGTNPERATFHIWSDNTPGCPGSNWDRPCNEQEWLRKLVSDPYNGQVTLLQDLEKKINFGTADANAPDLFQASDPKKQSQEESDAKKVLDDAIKALQDAASGSGKPNLNQWISDTNKKYDSTNPGDDPFKFCPDGPQQLGSQQYFGFFCNKDERIDIAGTRCGTDTKKFPTPCQDYWDFNKSDAGAQVLKTETMPPDKIQDYRLTKHFADETGSASDTHAFRDWNAAVFVPSAKGADASGEAEMDFIMVSYIDPSYMRELAANVGKNPDLKNRRVAVTASIAKIYRASDDRDQVRIANLCGAIDPSNDPARGNHPGMLDPPLDFMPATVWGWCNVLLASLDALNKLKSAIHGFFKPIIDFLNSVPFGLLGWLADIVQGFETYLLGGKVVDARTFHVALVPVACVPFLDKVAYIASNVPSSLGDILNLVENFALKNQLPQDTTSSCGPDQSANGGKNLFGSSGP
jgi:hypothetical protein